jgi:hypothetical protein
MKMNQLLFILILVVVSSCNSKSPNATDKNAQLAIAPEEKRYVMGTDDVPLFSGLELVEDDSSSFDTMLGNIVISKYFGDAKLKLVKAFYLEALPQLGWQLSDSGADQISFKREDDKLEIRFNYVGKRLYVRFFISSVLQ